MTHATGTLKLVLQNYWIRDGGRLMTSYGETAVDASTKRLWIGRYIDGEAPSSHAFVGKWLKMTEEEKKLHLNDAFPDE